MIVLLLVNLVMSLIMLALTHHLATENALAFYPSTIPVMVQSGVAAAVALLGLLLRGRWARLTCLLLSCVGLGLLFLPALYALDGWPGGDDGGAFGWMFFVGAGCLLSGLAALTTMIIGIIFAAK